MKMIPENPSEETLRLMLAVEYPATFRKELRSPYNGPETAEWTEKQIDVAKHIYASIYENLPDTSIDLSSIEGMSVSLDVSTSDADAGNRYFGTVTEISELEKAKNGYILLVQDAEPNFTQPSANQLQAEGAASVGMLIRASAYEFADSAKDILEECAMIADNRAANLRKDSDND